VPMGNIAGVPAAATDNPLSHSPHIGQHSRQILAEMGMSDAEVDALCADGTVAAYDSKLAAE
jgi:crotonobetainyl-CoA:carnitine CoA-transferase CaiB-like acyl-CoA transferase